MPTTRLYAPTNSPAVPGLIPLSTSAAGGSPGALPATQVIATATETVIVNPAQPTLPLQLQIPAGSPLDGQRFECYASGSINTGVSSTATIKLYSGTSLTVGSDTILASSGALTAFAGKANWFMSCMMIFDSYSGKLTGTAKFVANNVLVAEVAISTVLTGLTNRTNPVANFLLSATFGTASATSQITVTEFAINY